VSLAGQYIPDEFLQTCDKKAIIIAIDNPAFERSDRAAEITREIITATIAKCPQALVHTPNTKDWNDDLRQPKLSLVNNYESMEHSQPTPSCGSN
jgi:hypothetical protein